MYGEAMKKTITLIELIIAVSLLAVMVLGAVSFDAASGGFLRSSERKTQVLNELTHIANHFSSYISLATGDKNNIGMITPSLTSLRIRADISNGITRRPNETPNDYTDDLWVQYRIDGNNLEFCSNFNVGSGVCDIGWEALTQRFVDLGFSFSDPAANNGIVSITNLALRYSPLLAQDSRDNPQATMTDTGGSPTISFYSLSHSWN